MVSCVFLRLFENNSVGAPNSQVATTKVENFLILWELLAGCAPLQNPPLSISDAFLWQWLGVPGYRNTKRSNTNLIRLHYQSLLWIDIFITSSVTCGGCDFNSAGRSWWSDFTASSAWLEFKPSASVREWVLGVSKCSLVGGLIALNTGGDLENSWHKLAAKVAKFETS